MFYGQAKLYWLVSNGSQSGRKNIFIVIVAKGESALGWVHSCHAGVSYPQKRRRICTVFFSTV